MKMLKVSFLVMSMLGLLIFTQSTATAEISLNFYIGGAFTGEEDVDIEVLGFRGEFDDVDYESYSHLAAAWPIGLRACHGSDLRWTFPTSRQTLMNLTRMEM